MLEGIVRESIGKKASKALRRDGYLIANIYGKGLENIEAAFKVNEFIKEARKKESLAFDVKVGGKVLKVVIVAIPNIFDHLCTKILGVITVLPFESLRNDSPHASELER